MNSALRFAQLSCLAAILLSGELTLQRCDAVSLAVNDDVGIIRQPNLWPEPQPSDFDAQRRLEADYLAISVAGGLLPDPAVRDKILVDLNAIRSAFPEMANITHQPVSPLGHIIVRLDEASQNAFELGEFSGFEQLFEQLGQPTIHSFKSTLAGYHSFDFHESYNPEVLQQLFSAVGGVESVGVDFFLRPRERESWAQDVEVNGPYYTFWRESWRVTPGSFCGVPNLIRESWTFSVIDGKVTLVPEPAGIVLGLLGSMGAIMFLGGRPRSACCKRLLSILKRPQLPTVPLVAPARIDARVIQRR